MVQNLILEVLSANLAVSQSLRITEIGLGIIGNLACHEIPRKQIASTKGLVGVVVEQLLLDDVPCLCEACRTFCINASTIFVRFFFQSVGLLLAVLESQQEVAAILLPPISKLDILNLLIKLLAFEMSKLKGERIPERYTVLDLILRAIEVLSTMDNYSQEICLNKELLQLAKELIELPDKYEVSSSCVTAVVLLANILTDAPSATFELSQDLNFLQGVFNVFPFASDDAEAQSAIWSVIARLLTLVQESEMSPSIFHFLVSILASKLDLIEDEILVRPCAETDARIIAVSSIYFHLIFLLDYLIFEFSPISMFPSLT
ncbi:hypothetical protein MIMGU_mgv1a010288mg [Erythranthe guttata]|uniref:Uncharacterized protein n=1 Tax=Erythranthe guttata TaxID=4155 RepID=A0A022R9Q9_ERYGU|nr:hypothetical protein MIMGU_mgv1a010288mg [Erythranthe guttata]